MIDKFYNVIKRIDCCGKSPIQLIIRLVLAYGFYEPAMMKLSDINSIGEWFEGMGMPLPYLNAYMATYTEVLGVFLLILGLGTRFVSIALTVVMFVAIKTVHWENGFAAGENGYEIPLYYIIFLLVLLVQGAGKYSIDYFVDKKYKKN